MKRVCAGTVTRQGAYVCRRRPLPRDTATPATANDARSLVRPSPALLRLRQSGASASTEQSVNIADRNSEPAAAPRSRKSNEA